jgi:hypothetical protein
MRIPDERRCIEVAKSLLELDKLRCAFNDEVLVITDKAMIELLSTK